MNKRFGTFLLCGALAACTMGTFTSCDDDNYDADYNFLDQKIADLQDAINKGASIVDISQSNGATVLTLSNGQQITLGASMSVTVTDKEAIITVGDNVYKIPLSKGGGCLQYAPEYADGLVKITGKDGVKVRFAVIPAITAADLANIEGSVVAAYALQTRSAQDFSITFESIDEDGLLVGTLRCLNSELGGHTYNVCVQMNNAGAIIGSNFFQVEIPDGVDFDATEAIDPNIKPKDGTPAQEDGTFVLPAISGAALGAGANFAALFDGIPAGSEFALAGIAKQGQAATDKFEILRNSLQKDGSFAWAAAPHTDFGEDGINFVIKNASGDIVAKFNVTINDELKDADFSVFDENGEVEWGGRWNCLNIGENTVDLGAWFANALEIETTGVEGFGSNGLICHFGDGQGIGCLDIWNEGIEVQTADQDAILSSNDKGKFILSEIGKAYAPEGLCRGVFWFNRGMCLPNDIERLKTGATWDDCKEYNKEEMNFEKYFKETLGGNDFWLAGGDNCPTTYVNNPAEYWPENYQKLGIRVSEDGILTTPASYTGYPFRLALVIGFDYLYGVKNINKAGADLMVMLWVNRRLAPEGVSYPEL